MSIRLISMYHRKKLEQLTGLIVDPVPVSSCKPRYQTWLDMAEKQECYRNATLISLKFPFLDYGVQYVMGVVSVEESMKWVPHGWVSVGGVHYDPTWEKYREGGVANCYFPLSSIGPGTLREYLDDNDWIVPTYGSYSEWIVNRTPDLV